MKFKIGDKVKIKYSVFGEIYEIIGIEYMTLDDEPKQYYKLNKSTSLWREIELEGI